MGSNRLRFGTGPITPEPPPLITLGLLYTEANNVATASMVVLESLFPRRFQFICLHGKPVELAATCDAVIGNFSAVLTDEANPMINAIWEQKKRIHLIHAFDPQSSRALPKVTNVSWKTVYDLLTGVVDDLALYFELTRISSDPTRKQVERLYRTKVLPATMRATATA